MENNKSEVKGTGIILSIGFLFAIVAICFFIFKIPDFWPQVLAIIASAFLGAGATSWMTNHLLELQTESEEAKEKELKNYVDKITIYSEFIEGMWKQSENDDRITSTAIKSIRESIFGRFLFCADDDVLIKLTEEFERLNNWLDNKENEKNNYENKEPRVFNDRMNDSKDFYSRITSIIKVASVSKALENYPCLKERICDKFKNAKKAITIFIFGEKHDEKEKKIREIIKILRNYIDNCIELLEQDKLNETQINNKYIQAWHFTMFDKEQIDEAFKNNKYELSLIEYGETWRTNRVKQVKQGDIVFLFRRGGYGYIGAFIVKGWRVFYFEENREEIQKFENDKLTEVKGEQYETDIKEYDIYYSKDDGATLCANIIVEPIAFDYEGVKYPGGVYRHTIARYDNRYARTLLQRFLRNQEDNKPSYNKLFENIEMARVNTNKFNEIIKKLHILPAEKDENGNWK